MRRPRAVFIAPIMPARSGNGLAMRMGLFLEALSRLADVDLVLVPLAGGALEPTPFLQALGVRLHVVPVLGLNETPFVLLSRIRDDGLRLDAFRAYGKPSLASFLSSPVRTRIARIIEASAPDLVHIGRSYMLPCTDLVPDRTAATLDLDEDDLASFSSQARLAGNTGDLAKSRWLEQEGRACDALVSRFGARFRRVFASSRREALRLRQRHPHLLCEPMENAVELPSPVPARDDGATLMFLGTLSYAPNAEGILWFAREVMPRLRASGGAACRLLIAGAQPPAAVRALGRHPRVSVLGRVAQADALYRRSTLALAPLRAGGGTRIKLLEAAAHGVASISTPIGAEGLGWPAGTGGWVASAAAGFADACRDALSRPEERDRRARLARDWVARHHARENIVTRIARSLMIGDAGTA